MFEERIAAMNQRTEETLAASAGQFDKRTSGSPLLPVQHKNLEQKQDNTEKKRSPHCMKQLVGAKSFCIGDKHKSGNAQYGCHGRGSHD